MAELGLILDGRASSQMVFCKMVNLVHLRPRRAQRKLRAMRNDSSSLYCVSLNPTDYGIMRPSALACVLPSKLRTTRCAGAGGRQ